MKAQVVMYTTPICPYCIRAKHLLKKKGVSFQEVNVAFDHAKREWLIATTGKRTVPQIFINDEPIGGCDELYALEAEGKLDALLR
jgi:glutaredoxin 3